MLSSLFSDNSLHKKGTSNRAFLGLVKRKEPRNENVHMQAFPLTVFEEGFYLR